jgi:hypothetical protein
VENGPEMCISSTPLKLRMVGGKIYTISRLKIDIFSDF